MTVQIVNGHLTTEDVAAYLALSVRTVDGLREANDGPAFFRPTARSVRYRLADVDAWIVTKMRARSKDRAA